jgi:hypothetical protein
MKSIIAEEANHEIFEVEAKAERVYRRFIAEGKDDMAAMIIGFALDEDFNPNELSKPVTQEDVRDFVARFYEMNEQYVLNRIKKRGLFNIELAHRVFEEIKETIEAQD